MESVKPTIEEAAIHALLQDTFEQPIQELTPVQGGLIAQTLSFQAGSEAYILRFTTSSIEVSYQKEAFIYKNFASASIPIPPILKVGQIGDVYYAISKKLAGRGLSTLSKAEYEQTLPNIIKTLYAIHQVDVRGWQGYGWLDDNGMGIFPSWKTFIARIMEEEHPNGFYGEWHKLFQTTFLEREFFEKVYTHMIRLLEVCPEERYLVHGEYGYNNVLVQDGKVTAVLDWVDTTYGDFVYDIAWIDYWPRGVDQSERFRQYYISQGIPLPDFWQRVACYKCYMGLDAMRFFAKTNNFEAYQSTRLILQQILATT